MLKKNESYKKFLRYGSIISFMLDNAQAYDVSPKTVKAENKDEYYIEFAVNENESENAEKDIFLTSEFLYSQGVFNEYSFFHNFKDETDLKHNYYNSLFLVLPKGEYDSFTKLRALKRQLKNEYIIDNYMDIDHQQINDTFLKFKQEIITNQKYSLELLKTKENYVNFNDCIQFMHIKSGKFLEYNQDPETLKIYICLTETPSDRTTFRFVPAFNYQGENSAKVMNDLILKIACGGNIISGSNEKFISKREIMDPNKRVIGGINQEEKKNNNQILSTSQKVEMIYRHLLLKAIIKAEDNRRKTFGRARNARDSLQILVNENQTIDNIKDNFKTYINTSSIPYKGFGKKIIPNDNISVRAGNMKDNFWKLNIFSKFFFEDNKYINSLDNFSIQNNEKNLFIQAIDSKNKFKEKRKYSIFNSMSRLNEDEDQLKEINNNNNIINKSSFWQRVSSLPRKTVGSTSLPRKTVGSTIKLNYFYDNDFGANINYDLTVNQYEENDYIEPLGLFKFEFVYNYGKYGEYEQNRSHTIDILKDEGYVRLVNIFTNKVLMADLEITPIGNIYKLKLVNNFNLNEKNQKEFYKTIFTIEKVKDLLTDENENNNQENNKVNNKPPKKTKIKKDDYIKIKSKKYNLYLGIRLSSDTNRRSLILTNAMSDLTKFKLNFLDDIDKYELHFFEQLLWSFNNIINYFKEEKDSFSELSISLEKYSNYVKIEHILITLEKKINNFPENNKVQISQKNKFDFMKVIEYFKIVSKLIDIFLANWFHDIQNLDYFDCEKKLENYFKIYEEKEELTLVRCKTIISKEIFKILKTIYDLNQSYLNVIEDRLLYFLMFIGRDDKCTKFLIYLLKNNGTLIISLCPMFNNGLNNQYNQFSLNSLNSGTNINNNINNTINSNNINTNNISNADKPNKFTYIKHCLKRIMKTYNSMDFVKFKIDFSSVILLFNILNCLILYYQKPFLQFYDEYFKDLEILKTRNNETFPNYEQNSILVHFVLKNNKIFVKKKKFAKLGNGNEQELYEPLRNFSIRNDEYEFDLSELIALNNENDIDNNYSAIILAKLVAVNLIFYSHLSLCNQDFKLYLQRIFDFNIVMNNYLNNNLTEFDINAQQNTKLNEYDITNDLKYSLTKLMIFLYFRISFPFSGKMDLFYCLEEENINNIFSNLNSSIIRTEKPDRIDENMLNGINDYICNLLLKISQLRDGIQNYPFFVFEVLESAKYVIRNLFVFKNDRDKIDKAINLMSLIFLLLEKFFGYSAAKDILGRTKDSGDIFNIIYKNDLSLDENFYLITDNSKLTFEKYRKKLQIITKSKENITKKRLFKKILLILSSQKNGKKYFLNIKDTERRQKALEQLNKYQLSRILMELSTKGNVYEDNITENILLLICDIFLEFLKYIENLEMDHIFNQINKFNKQRQNILENQSEDEYLDILINSIIQDNYAERKGNIDYFEELENKYLMNSKEDRNKIYKENIFSIFKFLKIIDNEEFRNKILEILYRQHSQKKIFYENISNIVLFETQNQFNKFLKIKEIFLKLFNTVQNMNLIRRLDNNSYALFNDLELYFDSLIKLLIDERKWRKDNNVFITNGGSIFNNEEEVIKQKKDNKDLSKRKTIFNEYLPDDDSNNNSQYFISEVTNEDIFNAQQTFYNLGFIDLINQIFEYIAWVVEIKDELKDELVSLERILISIYKLLAIFIFNNQKHQFIIREKLFLYIQPLKLNIKSQDILMFIGYFLLNVAYFLESKEDFNQIQNLDEVILSINNLKSLDLAKNKRIIPFYVHSLKIFISFCSYEHFTTIYPVLEIINATLVREILNNTDTKEDITYIEKILLIIKEEQNKKANDLKTTPILSLHEIINAFLDMLNLIKENNLKKYLKLFKIFVIVTNIFYSHFDLYKNEFLLNKRYGRNLVKTLTTFCNSFNLTDETVYCSNNIQNKDKLISLNEFIGISLPKLYIILTYLGRSSSSSDDSLSCIINLSEELYEKILIMHENNEKEQSFIKKYLEKEIDDILKIIGSELPYLSQVREIIVPHLKLSVPRLIRSLINRKNLLNKLNIKDDLRKETFSFIWNKIRQKINKNDGLNNFQNFVKSEINQERMNYIKFLMNFFDNLLITNYSQNIGDENLEKEEINESIKSYFDTYIESIKESYSMDFINHKNEIYFFFWTNIHMMRYNNNTKKFISNENVFDSKKITLEENVQENEGFLEDNTKKINYFDYSITPYNKKFFRNSNFIEMTIKQFNNNKINATDYGYLLYIKFLNII